VTDTRSNDEPRGKTRNVEKATPKRLVELEPRRRRREVIRMLVVVTLTWVALIAGYYYLVPAGKASSISDFVRLGAGLLVVVLILVVQARRVVRAELPALRAVEALALIIPIFLLLFSTSYLSLSHTSTSMFSEKLDHSSSLYFTITVFSTVGFGDITPVDDTARIIVSVQMLMDLVIIGVVVRLLINAAKSSFERAGQRSSGQD